MAQRRDTSDDSIHHPDGSITHPNSNPRGTLRASPGHGTKSYTREIRKGKIYGRIKYNLKVVYF